MATNVCICADSLEVDGSGRLCVKIAPDAACKPNLLKISGTDGLQALLATYTLQRHSTAISDAAAIGSGNYGVTRDMTLYATVEDNGSAAGLWTIEADGSITINCAGIYSVTEMTIVSGATSHVVGGRSRVIGSGSIFASSEYHDFTNTVNLAAATDGPEFIASNTRYLAAGTVLVYDSRVYSDAATGGITYDSEFTLTYLGALAA